MPTYGHRLLMGFGFLRAVRLLTGLHLSFTCWINNNWSRKELCLQRAGETAKFDGLLRYWTPEKNLDIGAIEVSKPQAIGRLEKKTFADTEKLKRALGVMLHDLRQKRELTDAKRSSIQVIGFVCSGWGCTIFRMWADGDKYVMRERPFAVDLTQDLDSLQTFLTTLV
ncbi:MAG: hypothetical protein JWL86_7015, partial [Rhizobium sp.]|nr:hypothetical protein [Rhizobium sp.]